ncbi:beta-propeller domain-containing protein [Robertmurraya korlensis]|uniref:beta-propeller domain-containing protein n=1 Tax=Robertmurraya korlensis TaxID=519977 RepID=UPI00203ACFBB|nr:beta-propeller domain-containing protein [Robertmurraya korlensis]MCM3601468.1 beta-propeller domain-containing protein [Robertmurraya korlensis]
MKRKWVIGLSILFGLLLASIVMYTKETRLAANYGLGNELEGEMVNGALPVIEDKAQLNKYFYQIIKEEKQNQKFFTLTKEDKASEETSMENSASDTSSKASGQEVSSTNVQVQGIDEADIVKTDGEYIYQVVDGRVNIISAKSAEKMEHVASIQFQKNFSPSQLFLDKGQLLIIGYSYSYENNAAEKKIAVDSLYAPMNEMTRALVYDVKDPSRPTLEREISLEGYLSSARKIGSKVYLIANHFPQYWLLEDDDGVDLRPRYSDSVNKEEATSVSYDEIQYIPGSKEANYTTIAAFDLSLPTQEAKITTYLGSGGQLYMSKENLYLALTNWRSSDEQREEAFTPNTMIYKFRVNQLDVTFQGNTEVVGTVLNQFSMDEHNGFFRVATTEGNSWDESKPSKNHLIVFDKDLKQVGRLSDLAKGERIYSARFMGDRIYIVTFKETDPLFVIDASEPSNLTILGELKIPGFSNYLHPYDENHIIGFGYDTKLVTMEGEKEPRILTEGVKLSLFDISDVRNPKEKFTEIIGGRGTYSPLNYDHKALLYNTENGLFAFPINVYESVKGNEYEQKFIFQGAYVYNVSLDKGFSLKSKISHMKGKELYEEWENEIQRLVYIDEQLYALSHSKISSYSLENYQIISELELK